MVMSPFQARYPSTPMRSTMATAFEMMSTLVKLVIALAMDVLCAAATVPSMPRATAVPMAERTDEPYAFLASHKTDVAHPSDQSFIDHLTGVEAIMLTWAAAEPELYPAATAASGLYHSIYGTEGFQGFTLPLEQREVSRALSSRTHTSLLTRQRAAHARHHRSHLRSLRRWCAGSSGSAPSSAPTSTA